MPCIYYEKPLQASGILHLNGENAHYLANVLRFKQGSRFDVVDNTGLRYVASVISIDSTKVTAQYQQLNVQERESFIELILCQALLKGSKMDMVVQKATELGIWGILPLITERSVPQYTRKVERWKKIAIEALRQSGRSRVPYIEEAQELPSFLSEMKTGGAHGIIFYEKYGSSINDIFLTGKDIKRLFIVVGPEGGFCEKEVELARQAGFHVVSLGGRILRAETAAISVTAILQYLYGDINF